MNKSLLILLCLTLLKLGYSQTVDFNNYVPIKSRGDLPKEFSTSSLEKFQDAKKKISKDKSKIEKEALRDYELESSYAIDDILHSGKVIFNDTISNYVNAVMHKLMEQREKRKNVRVYVLRSSVVNAFATGKGLIFVTMGLIARMHSEAELAFVLSHEYIHYLKKHSINDYIESKKAKYNKGDYRNTSIDDKYLRRANFSKEQESESDELGFDLFTKTNYDISAATSALNTIWYYYLPYDSVTFKPSFFEKGSFKLPEGFFKNEYDKVDPKAFEKITSGTSTSSKKDDDEDAGEDESDKYSTHPSTDSRIEKLDALIKDFGNSGSRSLYLVSEATFKYIKKLCRYEIPRINLLDGDYEYAMYHAMVLLNDNPNSLYAKKIIAKSLYSMAKYGNTGHFNDAHIKSKYAQGHFQQLVFMMGKLKSQGISAMAMNYCWDLRSQNPDDEELNSICRSMMRSIVFSYEDRKKHVFYQSLADTIGPKIKRKTIDDSETEKTDGDEEATVKTTKSKKAKTVANNDNDNEEEDSNDEGTSKVKVKEYFKRSFIYWFEKDTAFANLYNEKMKDLKKKKAKVAKEKSKNSDDLKVNKSDIRCVKDGKVILIDPFYSYYEQRSYYDQGKYDAIKSEQYKSNFTDALNYVARKTFSEYEVLDQDQLKIDEAEKLSEITLLRDCLFENLNKRGVGLVSTDLSLVKQVAEKYHSSNIILTGMTIEKTKLNTLGTQCVGCYTLVFYPLFVTMSMSKTYEYSIFTVLYNTDLDDFRVSYNKQIRGKDTQASLTSNLYQILSRVKTY